MIHYGFTKELNIPYETVIEQVREALKKEGFVALEQRPDLETSSGNPGKSG